MKEDPGDASESFDYVSVTGLLDQILVIEPGNRNALNLKGIMYMGMQEQKKAIECFNAILKANPGDSEALNNGDRTVRAGKDERGHEVRGQGARTRQAIRGRADEQGRHAAQSGQTEEARVYLARANACDTLRP